MTVDKIERTLELPYPRERVWRAISDPNEISRWFSDGVTMEENPTVGSEIHFDWKEHGQAGGVVVAYEPPQRFAYRWWATGANKNRPIGESNSTLVTFELFATEQGTRLELTESGFAALPEEIREKSYQDNTGGWKTELGELVDWLEGNG